MGQEDFDPRATFTPPLFSSGFRLLLRHLHRHRRRRRGHFGVVFSLFCVWPSIRAGSVFSGLKEIIPLRPIVSSAFDKRLKNYKKKKPHSFIRENTRNKTFSHHRFHLFDKKSFRVIRAWIPFKKG